MTADHIYTVTVHVIPDPVEIDFDTVDLDLPLHASTELAMQHVQDLILDDPLEFFTMPTKLFVIVTRSDGETSHCSMSISYEEVENA